MLVSVPDAAIFTVAGLAVAALVIVKLSTALVVAEESKNTLPLPSLTSVARGVVRVGEVAKTKRAVPVAPVLVTPSNVKWPVTARVPGRDMFPLEFKVAVAEGVWEA